MKKKRVKTNLTKQPLKLISGFQRRREERATSPPELIVRQYAEMFQTESRLDVLNRVADWKCVSCPDG